MSKGIKFLLIGCGALVLIGALALGFGGYLFKEWLTGKVETFQKEAERRKELSRKYAFTPPADGFITENQIQRFLNVRRNIFGVYKKYEKEIQQMSQSQKEGLSGAVKGLKMINQLQQAQLQGLEQQKMSPEEYEYLVTNIYKTWFARGIRAYDAELQKSMDQLDQQLADPQIPEETKEQLRLSRRMLEEQMKGMKSQSHVPPANIALFQKYEKDLKLYSMAGLEYVGF